MKSVVSILCVIMLFVPLKLAAQSRTTKESAPQRKSGGTSPTRWRLGAGIKNFQEEVPVVKSSDTGYLLAQSQGLFLDLTHIRAFRNRRWNHYYGLEFAGGSLRGKGTSNAIADELTNQPWFSASFKPGLRYRTSIGSSLGIQIPVQYRTIAWKTDSTGTLKPGRTSLFEVGVAGVFELHTAARSSFMFSLGHQIEAKSSVLALSYNFIL